MYCSCELATRSMNFSFSIKLHTKSRLTSSSNSTKMDLCNPIMKGVIQWRYSKNPLGMSTNEKCLTRN